ncbi:MAG TPA: HAMP domain-containing sensor histidine kinase [Candidatus Limnocylindrales bacterium]|nr:HAMP domain-containing sensor histidine kinase [Candidatus Limnocylindrales bacterium]
MTAEDKAERLPDARLLHRVRWQLVAWSGLITLAILVALGGALYVAVRGVLDSAGTDQLVQRAQIVADGLRADPFLADRGPLALTFGGPASGTFAIVVAPDGRVFASSVELRLGLPVTSGLTAARQGRLDVREVTLGQTPSRVLSEPVLAGGQTFVVQVVGDRSAEQRTLDLLVLILGLGGIIALGVAMAGGAVYAGRALVPIRESLRHQREFAADASHELRTPLAVVRASVEHLRRHPQEPVAAVGDALDDIDAESRHMTELVDELLLLARADSGAVQLEAQPVDLAEVTVEAMNALAALAATRGVRLYLDPSAAPLRGDPGRLRQLVTILVDNAVRHGRTGGQVAVRVRSDEGLATLEVVDDGPGIPEADRAHVFDRFWRAPGSDGGSGLGLAIARWISEAHRGTIAVGASALGGARFEVRLRGLAEGS